MQEQHSLKVCTKCGEAKPPDGYHKKSPDSSLGVQPVCKECRREVGRHYYAQNRDRIRARVRARQKLKRVEYLDYQQRYRLLSRFGITREEWQALLDAQGGVCAICGGSEPGGSGTWHTDHCHATGCVRGILCHFCNLGLGNFRDDPARLEGAITYLQRHQPKP